MKRVIKAFISIAIFFLLACSVFALWIFNPLDQTAVLWDDHY